VTQEIILLIICDGSKFSHFERRKNLVLRGLERTEKPLRMVETRAWGKLGATTLNHSNTYVKWRNFRKKKK
ncbi:hypothetical protein M8745_18845, partial [Lutimaribacter sp. EGI FJ00014]|nr:hypothetical protein [Lutimaribacter sp. EGI FJ00014]